MSRSRAPKPLHYGMIATGNHGYFDSLRGATPLMDPPARIESALENLNLNSVQAENVPIFCLKVRFCHIGRAAFAEQPPAVRPYVRKFWPLRCRAVMVVRVGWGIQGRATSIAGAIDSAPPLYQFLWLLSCLAQESNTTNKNIPGFSRGWKIYEIIWAGRVLSCWFFPEDNLC